MGFSLPHDWVWDAWYVQDGPTTHMFFLKAPKAVGNPDHRHFYASIGHATSQDLMGWEYHGTALAPSAGPAWDDLTTWTGCVMRRPEGGWILYYTGTSRAERGHIQRIGAAVSDDLFVWEKIGPRPLLEADPQWYGTLGKRNVINEACRDPFVFQVEGDGRWHMYYTASGLREDQQENGVIGYAISEDMTTWQAQAPIFDQVMSSELEVPEVFELGGQWYLAYSTSGWAIAPAYAAQLGKTPDTGTYYLRSAGGPLGPWTPVHGEGLLTDPQEKLYVARKVTKPDGTPALIAFNNRDDNGDFPGTLTDPIAFGARPDGRLELTDPANQMKTG